MLFQHITDYKQALDAIHYLSHSKYIFLDTEVYIQDIKSPDYSKDKIRLIQLGNDKEIFLLDIFKLKPYLDYIFPDLKELLERKGIIGHFLKFDIKFLIGNFNIFPQIVFDTFIVSKLLFPNLPKYSLSFVYHYLTDKPLDKTEQSSNWGALELSKSQLEYAAKDILVLQEIFPILIYRINKLPKPNLKLSGSISKTFGLYHPVFLTELFLVPFISKLEIDGINLDENEIENLEREIKNKYSQIYYKFFKEENIRLDRQNELKHWFSKKFGIKVNSPNLSEEILNSLPNIEIKILLKEFFKIKRALNKIQEIKKNIKNNRIFPEIKQIASQTGRMYFIEPNIQNIPREIKGIIKAKKGNKLIIADYSQIELRIAAEYVKEEKMIRAFKENKDLHKFTASLIFNKDYSEINDDERKKAKAINFGLLYGMNYKTLKGYLKSLDISISEEEAKKFIDRFFNSYPAFKKWHEKVKTRLKEKRKISVYSLFGRKMIVNKFNDAINYPIQATGSDIFKLAIGIFIKEAEGKNFEIKNLVHDEIVLETEENIAVKLAEILKLSMEKAGKIILKNVPVEVDVRIADSWNEK